MRRFSWINVRAVVRHLKYPKQYQSKLPHRVQFSPCNSHEGNHSGVVFWWAPAVIHTATTFNGEGQRQSTETVKIPEWLREQDYLHCNIYPHDSPSEWVSIQMLSSWMSLWNTPLEWMPMRASTSCFMTTWGRLQETLRLGETYIHNDSKYGHHQLKPWAPAGWTGPVRELVPLGWESVHCTHCPSLTGSRLHLFLLMFGVENYWLLQRDLAVQMLDCVRYRKCAFDSCYWKTVWLWACVCEKVQLNTVIKSHL